MMQIGAKGTPAFRWHPTHLSIGPFLLWAIGISTLLLVRIIVRTPQEYASTVNFILPLIDFAYIIGAVFAVLQSGGKISDLGITHRYGPLALAIGLLVSFAIMGFRSLDSRFAGNIQTTAEPIVTIVFILSGAFHAFAEEVLFRGYFVGRLSKDFGWVPAIIISGIAYGLAPFAFLGADPLSIQQIAEIGVFFKTVFPAVTILGIFLAFVYRASGTLVTTWFGVTLSIWALGFIKGGFGVNPSFPIFALFGYIALIIAIIWLIIVIMQHFGHKPLNIEDIKHIVD